jgi:acetolactate synthase-1/2/3 large subunit
MSETSVTLAQQLATALAARGVRHAFGMPGGVLLHLIEAFRAEGIDFVLVRHEGSAGFMADVCAQLTDSPGVCLATLGPGVTNLVSPVAGAHLERSCVLAITGQIGSDLIGRYTHQILDQVALFAPVVRHGVLLSAEDPKTDLQTALTALETASPAGPVHIDVPAELWNTEMEALVVPSRPAITPIERELDGAVQAIKDARHPVMAVGLQDLSASASDALSRFVRALGVPVITTYRAKGMLDEGDPWCAGAFGLSPVVDDVQASLLRRSDLLIAVGLDPVELRPQWLPGWPSDLSMVSINSSPDILHRVAHTMQGSTAEVLDRLTDRTIGHHSDWKTEEILAHNARWRAPFDDGPKGPASTIRAVQRGMGPNSICSMDVGAHRITASHVWHCTAPLQQVQSNGFSSMGTGLPGAIAAKLTHPSRPVVALTGDMGLWMTLGELGVVQERQMDLVVVYLADQALSLIALKQERIPLPTHGVTFENPDVVSLAAAFGGTGHRVCGAAAVEEVVRKACEQGGLHLIEAQIDPSSYRQQM